MSREAETAVSDPGERDDVAASTGVLESELVVEHPRLVLGRTMDRLPDATVRSTCGLDDRPETPTFFRIGGVEAAAIDRAIEADPTVTDPRRVASDGAGTYRVRVTERAVPLSDPAAERCIQIRSANRSGVGWRLRLCAPDREALRDYRGYCLGHDVDVTVERVSDAQEWLSWPVTLSERDRATIEAAMESGYFEIPRRATQDDLAERLGVSGSAVSQRLRRAMRHLAERSVGPVDERWHGSDDRP